MYNFFIRHFCPWVLPLPSGQQMLFLLHLEDAPPAEEGKTVLDRVDGVADDGEDDEEADDYYGNDDVAADHDGDG